MLQPYVSRPEAEEFLTALGHALEKPQANPVVFHVWGIGGMGKSTLTRKVQETYQGKAKMALVSFGFTEGIDEPIPLMANLYGQLVAKDAWNCDPFWDKYTLYFETIQQLQTQATNGRGEATPEQVGQVKQLLQFGMDVAGEFFLSEPAKKTATTLVDRGIDAVAAGLSLKDSVQQLLQQHKATRRNVELQEFMLAPLPHLTQAFVAGLGQQGQQQPIILVLDTYEKAPTTIDTWLWRTLLGNTNMATQPVRLVIAGRHSLLKTEGWRKLQQDRHAIRDLTIERFDLSQTQDYLAQIGLTDPDKIERISQVTRGLPYYLNWIREETQKGRTLNFDQGNQEIVRLLLQGLNDTQKFLIQLAACCRWFDTKIIRHLTEKESLDFASAVDEERNCYGWLAQVSFVEPTGKHWRLDDVARDVFRQSLDRDDLSRIHSHLADYFLAQSNQEADPNGRPSDQYENPDWRELRSEYLYHLLFAEPVASQQPFLTHLLEARYFRKDDVVKTPFQTIVGEFELDKHPLLRYRQQQFLGQVRPAVLHGWAVLEESPIDYDWNEKYLKLSKVDTDQAITLCLGHPEQFTGLAQVLALYYRSRRCPEDLAASLLLQAYDQALLLSQTQPAPYLADLYFWKLGNALFNLGQYKAAIAAYDQALAIKPDDHEALNNKGIALRRLGQYEAAIAAYDQALKIKPDKHEAWDNKGCALATQGRFDEAIACFDKATSINPQYANAIYNKAYAVSKLGDLDEALALLQKAIALDPKYREMAKTDTDFDPIRHDERFRALVEGS